MTMIVATEKKKIFLRPYWQLATSTKKIKIHPAVAKSLIGSLWVTAILANEVMLGSVSVWIIKQIIY